MELLDIARMKGGYMRNARRFSR